MATAYISEYATLPQMPIGKPQIAPEPPIAAQTVAMSGTSAQSSAFSAQTRYIGVSVDAICSFLAGSNPTATTSKFRLPADTIIFMGVQPGDKIAFITNT